MKSLIPDYIQSYINSVTDKPNDLQIRLQKETDRIGFPMQTPHDQSVFLSFLVKLINAKRVIEVGVFTGYSFFGNCFLSARRWSHNCLR